MRGVELYNGDCLDVMRDMEENSVDTVVCDPPYGLSFMSKNWDHGVPGVAFWQEALRVAKPGAMLLVFGGTRTHHRLMVAIEDAGWEIRDCMMWLYGSGFPKSHDISKGIDKAAGATREVVGTRKLLGKARVLKGGNYGGGYDGKQEEDNYSVTAPATSLAQQWDGWGTALKPAWEPIIVAMKPLDGTFAQNAARHGVAGLNIDGSRIGTESISQHGRKAAPGTGWGEHWHNELEAGKTWSGRWPANLILDEEAARLLDEQSGVSRGGSAVRNNKNRPYGSERTWSTSDTPAQQTVGYTDTGGASRFFYCAKAGRAEREEGLEVGGNNHPTVKPLALMRYLVRLTSTPTGGIVLDPFMGSGTTGIAAILEGRKFIGIELDADYYAIAEKRIAHAVSQYQQLELSKGD